MITINFDDDKDGLMKITHIGHKLDVLLTETASEAVFDVLEVVMENPESFEVPEKVKIEFRRLRKERSRRERVV